MVPVREKERSAQRDAQQSGNVLPHDLSLMPVQAGQHASFTNSPASAREFFANALLNT